MFRYTTILCCAAAVLLAVPHNAQAQFPAFRVGPVRVGVKSGKPSVGLDLSGSRKQVSQPGRVVYRPAVEPQRTTCPTPAPRRTTPAPQVPRQLTKEEKQAKQLQELAAEAKKAFRAQDYAQAMSLADQMLKIAPKNSDTLQFRSLIRVAVTDYNLAAADAYDAVVHGPIWTMVAIKELYESPSAYRSDLEWMEITSSKQPQSLALQFLLAYHALLQGDLGTGETKLQKVLEIKPGEPVATKLLEVVQNKRGPQPNSGPRMADNR